MSSVSRLHGQLCIVLPGTRPHFPSGEGCYLHLLRVSFVFPLRWRGLMHLGGAGASRRWPWAPMGMGLAAPGPSLVISPLQRLCRWAEPPPQQCPSTPGAALPDPCPGGWDSLDVPNDFGIDPQHEQCKELESFNLLLFSPALCEMRLFSAES